MHPAPSRILHDTHHTFFTMTQTMNRLLAAPLLLTALLLSGCESSDNPDTVTMGTEFTKEGTLSFVAPDDSVLRTIDIEIADTPDEQRRGLMFRRSMGFDRGMLFVFEEAAPQTFIMENTSMSLDMIFVGPDAQVVSIAERTAPLSDERYSSTGPAQFVVEVRAGFADRFGITEATRIRWQRTD